MATLVVGAIATPLCLVPFDILEIVIASGVAGTYLLMCLAAVNGRLSGATAHAAYRMPLFPLFPALGLVALVGVVWASWLDKDSGRPGLVAVFAIFAVSALYYWLFLRRSAWTHRGPSAAADAVAGE